MENTQSEESSLATLQDLQRLEKMLQVIDYARRHDTSWPVACAEIGLPKSTFYDWLQKGILEPYIKAEMGGLGHLAVATVLDALPAMLTEQVKIATGKKGAARDSTVSFQSLMKFIGAESLGQLIMDERQQVEQFLDQYRPENVELHFHYHGAPPDAEAEAAAKPLELPQVVDGEVVIESDDEGDEDTSHE